MFEIIPGILEKEWREIEAKLEIIKPFAETVHIDIIDGKFADNLTFLDPSPFQEYSEDFLLELHMMVDNPIQYLKPFADAGFKRFIGHIEKMSDPVEFVAQGQLLGEVGIAIDGPTNIDSLKNLNLNDLDCLTVMCIKAGMSGQKFQPDLLKKIRKLKNSFPYLQIEADGGINDSTILNAKKSGATRFIANSFLFNGNPEENFRHLQSLLK